MKASELVRQLQEAIERLGDQAVFVTAEYEDVGGVSHDLIDARGLGQDSHEWRINLFSARDPDELQT